MKQILFLILIFFLAACQPPANSGLSVTPSWETGTAISAATKASYPEAPPATTTNTPTPSEISSYLAPRFFDPSGIKTFTPVPLVQCPKELSGSNFDAKKATDFSNSNLNQQQEHQQYVINILDYLNSGGTLQSVIHGLNKQYGDGSDDTALYIHDVTGDGIPELIFPYGVWMDVFGCEDGKYQLLFAPTYESDLNGVFIIAVTDINRDGLAEIVVYFNGCFGGRCPIIRAYEWDGKEFQDLIAGPEECNHLPVAPFEVEVRDIDNNGTKEIILRNNGKVWPDIDFPYRQETRSCMWNGQNIVLHKSEFDAPYYRFQAVQDGDRAASVGDYNKALGFYKQAIDDKKLEWFTQERKLHDFWVYHANFWPSFKEPTPTISPSMTQDPNEYLNLAAYSNYRIMLLYVLQENLADAETVYNALQAEYPLGKPGGYFAHMASVFWRKYKTSQNIQQACGDTIAYAATNSDMLKYLGDWDHGAQSINYTPESVCAFK